MKKNLSEKLTVLVFLIFIGGFSIANLLAEKKTFSENENRNLAPAPALTVPSLFGGKFDDEFETWFSDHFISRDRWIELKAFLKKTSGSLENNDVYYAADGRLIRTFNTWREASLQQNIDTVNAFLEDNQLHAAIMIVPTASYGQRGSLPVNAEISQPALLDRIEDAFAGQTFVRVDDRMNGTDDLYYHTDHHWNHAGARLGYEAIAAQVLHKEPQAFTYTPVSDSFYGTMYSRSGAFWVQPDTIVRMDPVQPLNVEVAYDNGQAAASLFMPERLNEKDQYTYYLDGNHAFLDIHTDAPGGRKALIIKDSFAHILLPYLAAEYSELQVIDLRYYHSPVSDLALQADDIYFIYSLDNFCEDPNLIFLR